MTSVKDQLIKLGAAQPELRPHIRPILAELESTKTASTGYTPEEAWEILTTAMNQMTRSNNGMRRLQMMIGAKQFVVEHRNAVYVRFKHTPSGEFNKLRKSVGITKLEYNPDRDDYTLTLMTPQGSAIKSFTRLYGDQIKRVFEEYTGLALSL